MNQKLQTTFVVAVIMVVFIAVGTFSFIIGERNQPAPQPAPVINVILPEIAGVESNIGSAFATDPETIIGTTPTTSVISFFNTDPITTSTPTTTNYFSIGPNVNKVNLNLIVNASTTNDKSFLFSYEVSGKSTGSTTQAVFLTPLIPSSGIAKTYTIASTTNIITLPNAGFYKLSIPLCSNTYDGTDDIPTCSTGLYKFQLGRIGFAGIEVYAEIDRE